MRRSHRSLRVQRREIDATGEDRDRAIVQIAGDLPKSMRTSSIEA